MRIPYRAQISAIGLALAVAAPASAGPTVGLGVSFAFGSGAQIDTNVGVRIFSNDRPKSYVGTLGLDYMLGSQTWRGTGGLARLERNTYYGIDAGYGLVSGMVDVGAGVGVVNTR